MTPGEVENVEDICYFCDECNNFDGDRKKRSQRRTECKKYRPAKKYLEAVAAAEEKEAKRRRSAFKVIVTKGQRGGSEETQ
jgi:hypothetical protein